MSKLQNPFIIYGYNGPGYFCDREAETAELIASLRNGRNVTLRSARRIGKTGLIYNAFHHIRQTEKDAACFYIDIFPTKTMDDFVSMLGKAVIGKLDTPMQKVEGHVIRFFNSCRLYWTADPISGQPQLGLDFKSNEADTTLRQIFDYIKQSGRQCYIAIDEFQQIAEYKDSNLEATLRSLVQFVPNAHFVFSGSKQHLMNEIFSSPRRPFYRSTEKMGLDVLGRDVYYEFAAKLFSQADITLSREIFDWLYSLLDGVTWYMQHIFNHLYQTGQGILTMEDVRDALDDILRREEDDYLSQIDKLTANQTAVLKAIASEGIVSEYGAKDFLRRYNLPANSSVKCALDYLLDKELVYHANQGYIVYDRFMALWMKRML